jgi:Ran GTPase-activating protein (RanGAP) involved in mRNA processing and transport
MHKLNLNKTELRDEGIHELVKSECFIRNLTKLTLKDNEIGNPGLEIIAKCPYLQNLTKLQLGFNVIGDEGIFELADSTFI